MGRCSGWHAFCHHRIGSNYAVIPNCYFANNFRASTYQNIITYDRRIPRPTSIPNSYSLIERTIVAYLDGRMENYAAKVMDPATFSDPACCGNRYARGHLNKSLANKTQRLPRQPFAVQPVEKSVDGNCLEALGE